MRGHHLNKTQARLWVRYLRSTRQRSALASTVTIYNSMMKDYSTGYIFLTILENLLFLCMVAVSITGYLNQIQSSSDDCWSKWKLKTVNKQLLFFDIKFNCLILKLLHLSSSKIYWHRYSGISGTIVLALTGHVMWSCRLRLTWMYSPSKPVYRSFHLKNVSW